MFKTLKHKLLGIFLLYSILCLSLLFLSTYTGNQKDNITDVEYSLTNTYISLLHKFSTIHDFFTYDTKNDVFFKTGRSLIINKHDSIDEQIGKRLRNTLSNKETKKFNIDNLIQQINLQILQYNDSINLMIKLIILRGYKDYGYEGQMRQYIHRLESKPINQILVLSIRRNEKDYINRNEMNYVQQIKNLGSKLKQEIETSTELDYEQKDDCQKTLTNYLCYLDSLVSVDAKMGIKNNTALKMQITLLENKIQKNFNDLITNAFYSKENMLKKLSVNLLIFSLLLIGVSLLFSFYLSKRITSPISLLAKQIHLFVESGFTKVDTVDYNTNDKEIENLIQNFSYLKDEIYSLLTDFKHKVEERTAEILKQKNKIEHQKDEIECQNEQLVYKNTLIGQQKKNIEEHNRNLLDSIKYARKIQNALMPEIVHLLAFFPESFICYLPKDILSGDFYWFQQIKSREQNITLIAAADCTGHGVPGAMLSMLSITLLNEIVLRKNITCASQVLNELRKQIKKSLQQTGQKGEQQDGLDIAFCAINNTTLEMSFAGAHSPLWWYRSKEQKVAYNSISRTESPFTIVKADRQPVGVFMKERSFTEHKLQLEHGDILYLATDGYASQFGGSKRETYKSKRFRELLNQISNCDMEVQKKIIETNFIEWKGTENQTDDVLIIGIKI